VAQETEQDLAVRTFFRGPRDADYRIQWASPAGDILRLLRASAPAPGAWTTYQGRRLRVLHASRRAGCTAAPGTVLRWSGRRLAVACADAVLQISVVGDDPNTIRPLPARPLRRPAPGARLE
ncbi:MAG TPA: hypothetical protein VM536_11865, partial [Chloroflexia bacterium]|nr:hypothetical protein [Chloroflexia bacterium]